MCRLISMTLVVLAAWVAVWADDKHSGKCFSRKPFFDARSRQTSYAGPGREKNPPTDIRQVLIGYFGPSTPYHPQGDTMWCAACLAIEQANQAGGYSSLDSTVRCPVDRRAGSSRQGPLPGLPFRLVAGWSDNPWGSGITQVTRMAYAHRVWAVIGGIDGPSTHLAEQVVTKARLTLLSAASTDRTANLANVPWMFSCLPPDDLQAPVLARAIASRVSPGRGPWREDKPFLLVSAVDHDSHVFTVELIKSLVERRLVPAYHFEFNPSDEVDFVKLLEAIVDSEPHALVVIAGARPSARLIRAAREKGFSGLIFGGPCLGQHSFLAEAGQAAENVIFPLLYECGDGSSRFEKQFVCCCGKKPDYPAAYTYDAVNLLIAAIRKAGLNRARICDAVRQLSPWSGMTGAIKWDSLGSNSRPVRLGTIRSGEIIASQQCRPAAKNEK
jgi:branched-chain amino acid transport system substrate-binding protein